MADARSAPGRNRRLGEKRMGRKLLVFVGDCNQAGEALAKKPCTPLWMAIGFCDIMLRSYGQVLFCNNPVTGLLVMIALFISDPFSAFVGIVAATVAIFSAWLIDQPEDAIRAGIYSYNALVLGHLSAILLPEMAVIDWIFIAIGSIFSVYFTSAFGTLFGSISKHPMPALTVPFVLAQILVYLCAVSPGALYFKESIAHIENSTVELTSGVDNLGTPLLSDNSIINDTTIDGIVETISNATSIPNNWTEVFTPLSDSSSDVSEINATTDIHWEETTAMLDWGEVFTGALKSMGQVFGQEHLASSLLMYLGVVISSPTTALMGLFGSVITTIVAAVLRPSPVGLLYSGVWGFNGLLTASALGGFALVLTPQSAGLTFIATTLTGVVHCVLLPSFQRADVPMLSLPFNLVSLLLLCTTATGSGSLVRPPTLSYPEKHRRDWMAMRDIRSRNGRSESDSQEDENDKKEQFRKLEIM